MRWNSRCAGCCLSGGGGEGDSSEPPPCSGVLVEATGPGRAPTKSRGKESARGGDIEEGQHQHSAERTEGEREENKPRPVPVTPLPTFSLSQPISTSLSDSSTSTSAMMSSSSLRNTTQRGTNQRVRRGKQKRKKEGRTGSHFPRWSRPRHGLLSCASTSCQELVAAAQPTKMGREVSRGGQGRAATKNEKETEKK